MTKGFYSPEFAKEFLKPEKTPFDELKDDDLYNELL
jgi:hypothetical protein